MVPRAAGLAFMEIKSSNYSEVGTKIEERLNLQDELVPLIPDIEQANDKTIERSLGVICLQTPGRRDDALDRLILHKRVAVILRRAADTADITVNTSGVVRLTKFLMHVRLRARRLDGRVTIRDPAEM